MFFNLFSESDDLGEKLRSFLNTDDYTGTEGVGKLYRGFTNKQEVVGTNDLMKGNIPKSPMYEENDSER